MYAQNCVNLALLIRLGFWVTLLTLREKHFIPVVLLIIMILQNFYRPSNIGPSKYCIHCLKKNFSIDRSLDIFSKHYHHPIFSQEDSQLKNWENYGNFYYAVYVKYDKVWGAVK